MGIKILRKKKKEGRGGREKERRLRMLAAKVGDQPKYWIILR